MWKSSAPVQATLLALLLALQCGASPIRYDQRQDGDQNVDARLQNFFVVVSPSAQSGISLLDLASKAVPLRLRPQGIVQAVDVKQREETDDAGQRQSEQTEEEVKESKSGRSVMQPQLNTVAISPAILQSPLAKLHPEVQALSVGEVLVARSPVIELRSPLGAGPAVPAVPMLVAVPVPEVAPERPAPPPALLPMHPGAPAPLGDKASPDAAAAPAVPESLAAPVQVAEVVFAASVEDAVAAVAAPAVETNQIENSPKQEFEMSKVHLIGTGIEECGPERIRDDEGVCVDAK